MEGNNMSNIKFKNCKITAIKTVVPKNFINIDDEIRFFENSEKKLNRTKKILGFAFIVTGIFVSSF